MKNFVKRTFREYIDVAMKRFLLIFILIMPCAAYAMDHSAKDMPDYTLQVSFDVPASIIRGIATIPVVKGQELKLHIGRLSLIEASIDGQKIAFSGGQEIVRILPPRSGSLVIRYEGIFRELPHGEQPSDVISDKGLFLTGTWYPKADRMCRYHLTAILPDGYEAISEAETIEKSTGDHRAVFTFDFPHPLDAITLIASNRYNIVKERAGNVEIFAYFFPEDGDLVKTYIENAKHYLELYDTMIDQYPYKRFSIAENFLPTGYSMPTYTLLGQEVVRLPFIPETSLGHEILHQWFGNSVYVDYQKGNWAEGLTTFLADHLYQEEKGLGPDYRKGLLIDYQSYVNDTNEFPLRDFTSRAESGSEAIGYGKALMLFQMLRDLVGRERFYESIKYFTQEMRSKKASWEDIGRAFTKYYQKDLTSLFKQWIDEKGLPELHLEEAEVRPSGSNFEVAFSVLQKGKVYTLDLPVAVYSYAGKTRHSVHLSKEKERFEITVEGLPERIALDEEYDVGRRLSIDEFPPVIARLLGDEKRIIVRPPSGAEVYEEIIAAFKGKGDRVSEAKDVTLEDLRTHTLIILGADNPMVGRLYGTVPMTKGGFNVVIKENPWNRWKVTGIFNARTKGEVDGAFYKVFHYGKYSRLAFDHGTNVYKEIDDSAKGITRELHKEAVAVDIPVFKTLAAVTEHVADDKVVYVGEAHDQFSHHVMELEIIKALHGRGKKIAIGMEMFQRPFQKVVDEYIEGRIDEAAFLKGTEYFKRWGFDYNLYRPILLFARSEKIPVVALNQRQEIVDKVFRSGLDSLSEDEKKSVPSQMDFSDDAYRERLTQIFSEHKGSKPGDFDFFYQAQILWDETMSDAIDLFLRLHPEDQMVVLAGDGHLSYGSGIPQRTARRNGYRYAIVLNDLDLDEGIGDFVLFPGTIPGVTAPRLMVELSEEGAKVGIAGFPKNSVSERAGMKVGDIIQALGGTPIQTVDDVKIELLSRKKGEAIRVRVLRKGFFGSNKEMDFDVVLQ
jgi:uncharacterized iron-regulated protein